MFHGRMFGILHETLHADLRAVRLELAAEHFDVGIHRAVLAVERVTGRVHAGEAFAALDGVEERLLVREREVQGRVRKDEPVVSLQFLGRRFGHQVSVRRGEVHGERLGFFAELGDDLGGRGNGAVTETLRDRDEEDFLGLVCRLGGGEGAQRHEQGKRFRECGENACFHEFVEFHTD